MRNRKKMEELARTRRRISEIIRKVLRRKKLRNCSGWNLIKRKNEIHEYRVRKMYLMGEG